MRQPVKVVVWGTGQMGTGIIKLVLQKTGMDLVGVISARKEREGMDVSGIIGRDKPIGLTVSADAGKLLAAVKPDVVLHATTSRVVDAAGEIETALNVSANVISIAEEMSFPRCGSPELSDEIEATAKKNKVSVLGTGINPGFVLDLLVIALTGVCFRVDSITARRVNDLSPYGPSVLRTQGVGITPEEFHKGVADGSVVGHFGFPESISMIARSLGWEIERIEQTREPIVSTVERTTPFVTVKPGLTAGCKHTGIGYMKGKPVITLIHPQQVHPHMADVTTGDYIEITGDPNVSFSGSPEIPGGVGTEALAVNMIPQIINAVPGLYTMADLPVPAAIMGDVRKLIGGN
ncbi:MAG: NADP-binding protein [Deltaproteobacteria bacterium]|nr:NADP-binding protein [Candidatus Zymogenaceae bacterium]